MEQLKLTTAYVPVTMELTAILTDTVTLRDYLERCGYLIDGVYTPANSFKIGGNKLVTSEQLMIKQNVFVLTKEEFEKLLGDAFEAGCDSKECILVDLPNGKTVSEHFSTDQEQYIKSILP